MKGLVDDKDLAAESYSDPIFVSCRSVESAGDFFLVRKIVESVWSCPQYTSTALQLSMIADFLLSLYRTRSAEYLESEVFPVIKSALALTWEFPWHLLLSLPPNLARHDLGDSSPVEPSDVLVSLTRYVLAVTKTIAVVLDDAHRMSSASWSILTQLCSAGCGTVFVMSICVREVSAVGQSDRAHVDVLSEMTILEFSLHGSGKHASSNRTSRECMVSVGYVADYFESKVYLR